jgi:hypothetical protein
MAAPWPWPWARPSSRMRKLILGCLLGVLALSCATLLAESRAASLAAAQKLERIRSEKLKSGEVVMLSEDELNSYILYDYAEEIPQGVRDLRVTLLKDYGVAEALVDLEKLPAASSSPIAALGARLFRGEHKLHARCRFVSANGQGKVEVEQVELDGQALPDFLVDYLIESTVQPHLPDFQTGKPFPLANNLRQIRLEPANVAVVSY